MKHIFSSVLSTFTIALSIVSMYLPETCYAGNTTGYTIFLKKYPKDKVGWQRSRIPSHAVTGVIYETGLESDLNENDIIVYEIWNESSNIIIASFSEDIPFCQYLINSSGNYKVKLITGEADFVGFISTI